MKPSKPGCRIVIPILALALAGVPSVAAHAEDFFSMMFHAFRNAVPERGLPPMSYGSDAPLQFPPRPYRQSVSSEGGGPAYCVRTCDGRYFPVAAAGNQSRAETCRSFCPASETKVFYGRTIDDAVSENGTDYSDLPNAFKYRSQLVAGCSCNGSDPVGLAKVDIRQDKTLRRGDLVATADGLKVVSGGVDRRGAELNFSPAPRSVRARFERSVALE